MQKLIIATIAVLGFLGGSSQAAPSVQHEGFIVGGQNTDIKKYPYQVSVRLDTYTLLHICGGSIYSSKVVLTAAHCIKGRFASYIRIVSGQNSIVHDGDFGYKVSKLIPHPGYNKNTHENDVGLIILAEAFQYSDAVQPITLALNYPPAGATAVVTGWGKSKEEAETLTNNLQEVEVKIIQHSECSAKYTAKNYVITEQMICAGSDEGGKDSCQGDSGGPLAVDGVLVGIVSWGVGCARAEYPGVYASVVYHKQWIETTAALYQ